MSIVFNDFCGRGSFATRRRNLLRSAARLRKRGSTFWATFLPALASKTHRYVCLSWPDRSSTASWGSSLNRVLDFCADGDAVVTYSTSVPSDTTAQSLALRGKAHLDPWAAAGFHDDSTTSLMRCWLHHATSAPTKFSGFACGFLRGVFAKLGKRCRDVLPLPPCMISDLPWWQPRIGNALGVDVLNLIVAALNYLFMNGLAQPVPKRRTPLHLQVFCRLARQLDQALFELSEVGAHVAIKGSFSRLVSRRTVQKYPNLRHEDVDLVSPSAALDPLPFLDESGLATLSDKEKLFPNGAIGIQKSRVSSEVNIGDYISLTIRMLRFGKLSLTKRAQAVADTFVVEKSGTRRLREVWNGKWLTLAAAHPERPPMQATPAALANLECSHDRPLWLSTRDGTAFFDQLQVPETIRGWFGRPEVCVADLLNPPPCESGSKASDPMTFTEIQQAMLGNEFVDGATVLTPCSNAWPMGFGWSSYIAQSTMLGTCKMAGFHELQFLAEEHSLALSGTPTLAVATDDINHFCAYTVEERLSTDVDPLAKLDEVWRDIGLQAQREKSKTMVSSSKVLGVQLRNGTHLQARGARLWDLLEGVIDLGLERVAAPSEMQSFVGSMQWNNLLNRPMYSCLNDVYGFMQRVPDKLLQSVPLDIYSELILNIALFPLWTSDLTRGWWPFLATTDASPSFGFGLSFSKCSPTLVREVAGAASDPGAVFRLRWCPGDPVEVPRVGPEIRLDMSLDDFRDVFSIKARTLTHSGCMEAEAVKLALLRISRTPRFHSSRGVVFVDAQAVGYALRKGRSSAKTIAHVVRSIAAVSLACDLKLAYPYLPSESNAADWPSRGKARQRHRRPRCVTRGETSLDKHARTIKQAVRRWRQCGLPVM